MKLPCVQIHVGKIVEINKKKIKIFILENKKYGYCDIEDLSDFEENYSKIAILNSKHKFLYMNNKSTDAQIFLGYKQIHPEEINVKKKTMPTANHFHNLRVFVFNKWNFNFSKNYEDDDLDEIESFENVYTKISI